jgi:hypothetical protein
MKSDASRLGASPADPDIKHPLALAGKKVDEMQHQTTKTWNTKNLGLRLGADAASAASAAALVAPVISIIDRYGPFLPSPLLLQHPLQDGFMEHLPWLTS